MRHSFLDKTFLAAGILAMSFSMQNATAAVTASATITKKDTSHNTRSLAEAAPATKTVYLMDLHLTAKQKQKIQQSLHSMKDTKQNIQLTTEGSLPSSVDLGMNDVPVLDQGMHGTCATFATTAAIDALLGRGDYISQLCSLELGNHLSTLGYDSNPWDGSSDLLVTNQLLQFGIVTKENQRSQSCAGTTEYPKDESENTGAEMSLAQYKAVSERLPIASDQLLSINMALNEDPARSFNRMTDGNALLSQIKHSIAAAAENGNALRFTVGVMLPVSHCSVGACATHHASNDTWAMVSDIFLDSDISFGGHAMVITGYDDNATATDAEGNIHRGLLTLRNSWGSNVGDGGTYYMTYGFFKFFVLEVEEVMIPEFD